MATVSSGKGNRAAVAAGAKKATTKKAAKKGATAKPALPKATAAKTKPAASQSTAAKTKPAASKSTAAKIKPAASKSTAAKTKPAASKSTAAKTKPAASKSTKPGTSKLPAVGAAPPGFDLVADDGKRYTPAALRGRRYVVYFYPRDNTPGCTQEACDFRDRMDELAALGITVLGVSSDSLASHHKFRDKHGLNFPLLSDPDNTMAKAWGVYGEKSMYGRKIMGVIRSTFVIDVKGRVERVFSPVKVKDHVAQVAAALGG